MKYEVTLSLFDLYKGRQGEWKRIGAVRSKCDISEVIKSLDVAISDAETRLGVSSGEVALLTKMRDLFNKQSFC